MDRNYSPRSDEWAIHLIVPWHSRRAVIAVDEQEIQRPASKSLRDERKGGRIMRVRSQEEDLLSEPAGRAIDE
jgi:hypothetical protein